MFTTGQKVVCVDDDFSKLPPIYRKHYTAFPVKDRTYTIRAVYVARSNPLGGPGKTMPDIGVLLNEVKNPRDPRLLDGYDGELGFRAERFVPLKSADDTLTKVREEVEHVSV